MTEVLTAKSHPGDSACLSSSVLRSTHSSNPPFVLDTSSYADSDYSCSSSYSKDSHLDAESESSSVSSSPRLDKSPLNSSPPSSISLDPAEDYDDEDLYFPTYGNPISAKQHNTSDSTSSPEDPQPSPPSQSPATPVHENPTPDPVDLKPVDDTAVHDEPSRQVDYLSHDWVEEDICQSWRHIVANRRTYGERSRLENASWRTWAKAKYGLRTVSPEQLNWQKDCDVTWLYGPLQQARKWHKHTQTLGNGTPGYAQSNHSSNLSKTGSFGKRPILKKRSVSEVMLLKSLSSSSLVKQAAAAVQAQRGTPRRESDESRRLQIAGTSNIGRTSSISMSSGFASTTISEHSSGLHSPEAGGGRHIRFDDKVQQCIAVEFIPGNSSEDTSTTWTRDRSPDSSDDDLVMMRTKSKRHSSGPSSRRNSLGQESKGIAKLPSTTLKYHHDEPHCPGHPEQSGSMPRRPRLQASSSQETLRPSRPSTNFLLDDDEDGLSWEPSGAFDTPRPGSASSIDDHRAAGVSQDSVDAPDGLRRTPSGMFMPFEEEDESHATPGVLGRVVDTVNTARDIFSVIMNVGWRS